MKQGWLGLFVKKTLGWRLSRGLQVGLFLLVGSSCYGAQSTQQESLHLKRIAEYWKEGSYEDAKKSILSFLATYKESEMKDNLYAMLGDLYFQENNFPVAIQYYETIQQEHFQEKTRCKYITALFKMGHYPVVIDLASTMLSKGQAIDAKESVDLRYLLAESLYAEGKHGQDSVKLRAALAQYAQLEATPYAKDSMLPQATIYAALGQYQEASKLYLALAEMRPEGKEEYLFHAASAQSHFDTNLASQTFARVYALRGKLASGAAFGQLALLFQNQNYAELIRVYGQAVSYLTEEKGQQALFFLGKSQYELGLYNEAIVSLESYVDSLYSLKDLRKAALFHLFNCAKQCGDIALFVKTENRFHVLYPEDKVSSKHIDLLHAELALTQGDFAVAGPLLKSLLAGSLSVEQREVVLYDYALVLEKENNWTETCDTLLTFLREFPHSAHARSAYAHLIYASVEELNLADEHTVQAKKEQLVALLGGVLTKDFSFIDEEKREHSLLYARLLCELERFSEAISGLEKYLIAYADHPSIADAHMLLAIAYQDDLDNEALFTEHIEKALELRADVQDKNKIYKKLFNTYLSRDAKKAAHYLFLAHVECDQPIRLENQLWLANYYYEDTSSSECKNRALCVFEKIFAREDAFTSSLLEAEALKFCDLLAFQGLSARRLEMLQKLRAAQLSDPSLDWKHGKRTVFELARAYEDNGLFLEAMAAYDTLLTSSLGYSSPITLAASLNRARLQYALLSKDSASERDIVSILDALKDIQIQKRAASEPIHIEAALSYIRIKSELMPDVMHSEEMLAALQNIRREYAEKEYQDSLAGHPDKAQLVALYLTFAEAHILHLQAILARQNQQSSESSYLQTAALALIESLQGDRSLLTSYLKEGVEAFPQEILTSDDDDEME